jgi:hypothetical protein
MVVVSTVGKRGSVRSFWYPICGERMTKCRDIVGPVHCFFLRAGADRARDQDREGWCGDVGGESGFLKMVPLDRGDQCGHFGGGFVV